MPKKKLVKKETGAFKKGPKTKEGILSLTSKGVGYVAIPNTDEDIEIASENLGVALHGDTVKVALRSRGGSRRTQGEIREVLTRRKTKFVGVLERKDDQTVVTPDDTKMHFPIVVNSLAGGNIGDKVYVEMKEWESRDNLPHGDIIRVIGRDGDHDVEMAGIVLDKGFDPSFPPQVIKEAENIKKEMWPIKEEEIANRRDMRGTKTFTIDPADAKDFDDALSFKKLDNGHIEIGVHIADVSYYVRPGTALDNEARSRSFSVYLVDRTIPMLPEVLSNEICSLVPNEDRLTYSAIFEIDENGHVHDKWFGRAIIHSDKRFSYEEAQKVIDDGEGEHHDELVILNNIAKKMTAEKKAQGAIDFGSDEVKFELDERGKPVKVIRKVRLDTHKLIEEYMLLANREVATFFYDMHQKGKAGHKQLPFIYRVHDLPDNDRLKNLAVFAKALGYQLPMDPKKIGPKDLNSLLAHVQGHAEESLIQTAAIRTMAKAIYSTDNIGHFGLAFEYYTHFTSPIRRYPDLIVHRMMDLCQNQKETPRDLVEDLASIAEEASQREVSAVEAERESIKLKQVEYMAEHIGATFDGVITGVTEWGMYVADKETKSEGMIKIKDIGEDYFELDTKNYAIVGQKTKQKFALGDEIKFKVKGANIEKKQLDYELA